MHRERSRPYPHSVSGRAPLVLISNFFPYFWKYLRSSLAMTCFFSSSVISLKCFCRKSSASAFAQPERRGRARPARAVAEAFRINSLRVRGFSFIVLFYGSERRRFCLHGFEFRLMGIVAVGAEKIGPFT